MVVSTRMISLLLALLLADSASGFQPLTLLLKKSPAASVSVRQKRQHGSTTTTTATTTTTQLYSTKTNEKARLMDNTKAYEIYNGEEQLSYDFAPDFASKSSPPLEGKKDEDNNNLLGGIFWRGTVVVLCALWASNFPAAKLVMAEPGVDSSLYAVARFGVAALALAPFAVAETRKTGMDMETLKGSVVCGSFVAFGYIGQTLGLLTTTASRSCVICSLHCVFVAIVAELWRVSRETGDGISTTTFDFKRLIPAAIAVAGVAIIELKGAAGGPNVGDLLSFAQPIGFGMGYLQLEELMKKRPDTALSVSAIKLAVVALASLALFEITPLVQSGFDLGSFSLQLPDLSAIFSSTTALSGIVYTGLVTTALALWVESKAFARVPATDASIILTTEPLMAAAIGAVALGETFGLSDYAGASLIVGGCLMASLMDEEKESSEVMDYDPAKKM